MIKGMVKIYSDALETHAKKGKGSLYNGQEFVHIWEQPNTGIYGLPKDTIIELPTGEVYKMKKRTILMFNKKNDLWAMFEQE